MVNSEARLSLISRRISRGGRTPCSPTHKYNYLCEVRSETVAAIPRVKYTRIVKSSDQNFPKSPSCALSQYTQDGTVIYYSIRFQYFKFSPIKSQLYTNLQITFPSYMEQDTGRSGRISSGQQKERRRTLYESILGTT